MLLMPNYIGIHTMAYIDMRIIWPNFKIWFEIKEIDESCVFPENYCQQERVFVHSFRRVIALD